MTTSLRLSLLVLGVVACGATPRAIDAGGTDGGSTDAGGGDAACAGCRLPDPGCHYTDVCHCGGLVCDDAGATDSGPPIDAGPPCPASAPADGATCPVDGQSCTYDVCPGTGVARASCSAGTWHVATTACADHMCNDGMTCAADMVCVSRASGAVIFSCQPNPCGSGPFDCSCASSLCLGGTCSTTGTDVNCVIDCGGCP